MLARSCQEVALPFVVFSLTASTASTGVVQTAGMIAFLRFALFGGVLVDRVDRRAAMIARGLSGAVLWGLFGLLLAVGLLAGSALSKRYAPKVGSGTLLVSAMSVMAGLASATVFSHTYAALFVWLSAYGSPCRWSEPWRRDTSTRSLRRTSRGRVASLMSVLETGLSALVPLTVGPSSRRARSGRPTGWAWRPPSRRWPR